MYLFHLYTCYKYFIPRETVNRKNNYFRELYTQIC